MRKINKVFVGLVAMVGAGLVHASLIVPVKLTAGNGATLVGSVKLDDTIYGLLLTPDLFGLPPGIHGFHIHEMPMCQHEGSAAGAHFDPDKTGKHRGPYGNGHQGDLPVLIVAATGRATLPVLAPRLKLADIKNRALMIHAGGDNYSDTPRKLGGGGDRIACGVIPYF